MYRFLYLFNKKFCSICLSKIKLNNLIITPCLHYFHKNCLKEWFNNDYSCPNCRDHIKCYQLINKSV